MNGLRRALNERLGIVTETGSGASGVSDRVSHGSALRRHRFPPEIIQQAIRLYLRFTLSYRDVEELLAERGLDISYETVRRWVLKFGPAIGFRGWRPDMKFTDRSDAGRRLAGKLVHFKERQPVILALPRGGVAIGFEIAQALSAPLDIVLVRKIGVPWERELAVGAVTDGATPEIFIDSDLATTLEIPESYLEEETTRQLAEIERRREIYCPNRPPAELKGHTAIVVDDGIATGATMRVALRAMRSRGPSHLVMAVPVAPPDILAELGETADETVCLETPIGLGAIGFYYRDFHQMTDAEVMDLLARAPIPN